MVTRWEKPCCIFKKFQHYSSRLSQNAMTIEDNTESVDNSTPGVSLFIEQMLCHIVMYWLKSAQAGVSSHV